MTNPQHSETVKRYEFVCHNCGTIGKDDCDYGDYVLYSDHAALENGRDALVEALKEARKMCYTQNFYEDVERIRPLVDEALKKAGAM